MKEVVRDTNRLWLSASRMRPEAPTEENESKSCGTADCFSLGQLLKQSPLAHLALAERGFCSRRVARALRDRALRRPRREREQTPILFGRSASARCFAEISQAARGRAGPGTYYND